MTINKATLDAARARRAEHGGTHRAALAFVKAEREAARWNALYPVGTKCVLETYTGGPKVDTVTRSVAWALASGHASVLVEGRSGSYGLEWLTPVRADSIVGKRSGTVVVRSVKVKKMTVECDCGRVREMWSKSFYRKNLTCADRVAHPESANVIHALSGDYRYRWHLGHTTCAGWADVATFAAAVGEQPKGHGLSKTSGDVASCGECEDCLAVGAARNVVWTPGGGAGATAVLLRGEWMSQAEAGRRLGLKRETVRQRVLKGIPLEASREEAYRARGPGRMANVEVSK